MTGRFVVETLVPQIGRQMTRVAFRIRYGLTYGHSVRRAAPRAFGRVRITFRGNPSGRVLTPQPSGTITFRVAQNGAREERNNVAAAALEQSVLESKDKDTLLEMAKALGVKAPSRLKKSEIIDKILETTGPSSAPAPAPAPKAAEQRELDEEPAETRKSFERSSDSKPSAPNVSSKQNGKSAATDAGVVLGPDGDPLADWEIELLADGINTTTSEVDAEATSGDDKSNNDRNRNRNNGEAGDRNRNRNNEGNRADGDSRNGEGGNRNVEGGNRNRNSGGGQGGNSGGNQGGNSGGNQGGGQQGNRNPGAQNRNDDGGEGNNKRRRRRRKGGANRGFDGPQGEDVDFVETDFESQPQGNEPTEVTGYLDMHDQGYGFLRLNGYLPSKQDAYITVKVAMQFGLRRGDLVVGTMRAAQRNEKNPQLIEVTTVNGGDPEAAKKRPRFEDLTALFPDSQLRLENPADPANMTARIIDLLSPIGKGQRGIIVSPPKAGKTTVMKTIAQSIELNNPECKLIVLLIDERPEEVTDMKRSVNGEVISSTFDRPSDEHAHVAEMAIAKARRLVEQGEDVVIILDGITRLSRAYNLAAPSSGKILSGGIDAGALYPPKKFFGSARNIEEGGSLTILATALVDTNSRMDEAIFEEFKGTGNMELRLDRKIAERRIYPAIDVDASSTRHEELLFDRKQLQMVWKLRRVLSGLADGGNGAPGLELLIDRLKTFRTNAEFLNEIGKQPGM
jgi:transcription termination factor Rho